MPAGAASALKMRGARLFHFRGGRPRRKGRESSPRHEAMPVIGLKENIDAIERAA
jgi:hypothetical protein